MYFQPKYDCGEPIALSWVLHIEHITTLGCAGFLIMHLVHHCFGAIGINIFLGIKTHAILCYKEYKSHGINNRLKSMFTFTDFLRL